MKVPKREKNALTQRMLFSVETTTKVNSLGITTLQK